MFGRNQSQPVGRVVKLINPVLRGWVNYFAVCARLLPRVRRVISRTFALNRTTVCGASRRLRVVPPVKLKPKNFRTCGAATALFALLTFSLRRLVAARRFWGWWAVAASKDQLSNWTGSPERNNDSLQPSIRYKLQTVFVRF